MLSAGNISSIDAQKEVKSNNYKCVYEDNSD